MDDQELQTLIGQDEEAAARCVQNRGLIFRVTGRDGVWYPCTADLRPDRVNVAITDGKVSSVEMR